MSFSLGKVEKLFTDKQDLICPITQELFVDPVFVDGRTFERSAIERWFRLGHETNPLTMERISFRDRENLKSNFDVSSSVTEWKNKITNKCVENITILLENLKNQEPSFRNEEESLEDLLKKLSDRAYDLEKENVIVIRKCLEVYNYLLSSNNTTISKMRKKKSIQEKRDFLQLQLTKFTTRISSQKLEYFESANKEVILELHKTIHNLRDTVKTQSCLIEELESRLQNQQSTIRKLVDRISVIEESDNPPKQEEEEEDDDENEISEDLQPLSLLSTPPKHSKKVKKKDSEEQLVVCNFCGKMIQNERLRTHRKMHLRELQNLKNKEISTFRQQQQQQQNDEVIKKIISKKKKELEKKKFKIRKERTIARKRRSLPSNKVFKNEMKKCVHCNRRFTKLTLERHAPKCLLIKRRNKTKDKIDILKVFSL